jgi:cytochrome c551/c552
MNKILIILSFALLTSCGPSAEEKRQVEMEKQRIEQEASEKLAQEKAIRIAAVTCSIMSETRNMDAAIRVEKVNDAREKIDGEPFLRGDDAIQEAFEYGLCQELVLNEIYDETLQPLKDERERIAREKQAEENRIAREKQAEENRIAAEQVRIEKTKYLIAGGKGEVAYHTFCTDCHAYEGRLIGPSVQEIQALYANRPEALVSYINAPTPMRSDYPEMPAQNYLDAETQLAVANYILHVGRN